MNIAQRDCSQNYYWWLLLRRLKPCNATATVTSECRSAGLQSQIRWTKPLSINITHRDYSHKLQVLSRCQSILRIEILATSYNDYGIFNERCSSILLPLVTCTSPLQMNVAPQNYSHTITKTHHYRDSSIQRLKHC